MTQILIGQDPLTLNQLRQVLNGPVIVSLTDAAWADIEKGAAVVATILAEGRTVYRFEGDNDSMAFQAQSAAYHAGTIVRGPLSAGPGNWVWIHTAFFQPSSDKFRTNIPFYIGGGNGAVLNVVGFSIDRSDSGPSAGQTSMSWTVHEDTNGNCIADDARVPIAHGSLSVGPNGNIIDRPTAFAVPRGYYILQITYHSQSSLAVASADCGDPASDDSTVEDVAYVSFELSTP